MFLLYITHILYIKFINNIIFDNKFSYLKLQLNLRLVYKSNENWQI